MSLIIIPKSSPFLRKIKAGENITRNISKKMRGIPESAESTETIKKIKVKIIDDKRMTIKTGSCSLFSILIFSESKLFIEVL